MRTHSASPRSRANALALDSYAGHPVLIVNTASMCGFTYQYAALQRLYDAYRQRGLVVLGVPSNDFGNQEPGSATEIKQFCTVNFDVDFPLTEKVHVKGPNPTRCSPGCAVSWAIPPGRVGIFTNT